MKAAILLSLAMLFVFGCLVSGRTAGTDEKAEVQQDNNASSEPEPPPKLPSTANLSFSRNASDVLNSDTPIFERPHLNFSDMTSSDGRLIVYYFYSSSCSACKALRPEIDKLEADYTGVEWKEYDLAAQNGSYAYQDFAAEYNLSNKQRLVPQVLVNGTIITDRFNINKSLEGIISSFSTSG